MSRYKGLSRSGVNRWNFIYIILVRIKMWLVEIISSVFNGGSIKQKERLKSSILNIHTHINQKNHKGKIITWKRLSVAIFGFTYFIKIINRIFVIDLMYRDRDGERPKAKKKCHRDISKRNF